MTTLLSPLKNLASPSTLRAMWGYLRPLPAGGRVMGRIIGQVAPYTGTIRPEVLSLEPGYAKLRMSDRRGVRNHLSSVHAIALMNLGEATSGTAMMVSLPDGARGIITHLGMDYLKKARGSITCECRCEVPSTLGASADLQLTADLTNEAGDVVAKAYATWRIGMTR